MCKEEDPSTSRETLRATSFGYLKIKLKCSCICFPVKTSDKTRVIADRNSLGDTTSINKAL